MDDISSTASNVARAILAVLDYSSTSDTRKSAVEFLESVIVFSEFSHFFRSVIDLRIYVACCVYDYDVAGGVTSDQA